MRSAPVPEMDWVTAIYGTVNLYIVCQRRCSTYSVLGQGNAISSIRKLCSLHCELWQASNG